MITHLVRAGKRVGIVALSHKVIRNLLEKTIEAAEAERTPLVCLQKVRDVSNDHAAIIETTANKDIDAAVAQGTAAVIGGTSYLWARPEMENAVDVLFVDEAGQLALVDVLAVSHAATSLVLLGDPQQLKQPQQGTHPDGTDVSALEHILGEHQTLPSEQGLFLHQTFRMHPEICSFISEQFYENRLGPRPNLDRQVLSGDTTFTGGALWFASVHHEGNQNSSSEEADTVAAIAEQLTAGGTFWTDTANDLHVVTADDVLIIAPYNAQVAELSARLPSFRIGTVDKFQGQEAPIVICSMATSSPEDAPRGMEFLYSRNRFNVAISRARTAAILVTNPKIFEPDCQSPAQMRLANSFCRYKELALLYRQN